jgi:hypothetical protein
MKKNPDDSYYQPPQIITPVKHRPFDLMGCPRARAVAALLALRFRPHEIKSALKVSMGLIMRYKAKAMEKYPRELDL